MSKKANNTEQTPSIATMIIRDLKKQRLMLYIANILLAIALIITIFIGGA